MVDKDGRYLHFDKKEPYKHCLFLLKGLREGDNINNIKLQDLQQILFWKKEFNRIKDIEDLQIENHGK